METAIWYDSIIKPAFAPPAFVFGIVWSILYPVIFISFIYIAYLVYKKKISKVILIPLTLNLLTNLAFSPIQFGLQNNLLAAIDIIAVLFSLVWIIKILLTKFKLLAYVQIPYLVWVSFATVLQFSILWLNWEF